MIVKKFVVYTLFSLIAVWLLACKTDMKQIERVATKDSLPDVSAQNTTILYSDSGFIEMKAVAPELNDYNEGVEKPYSEFPKGIKIWFFDNAQDTISRLTAGHAIYDKESKIWEARYNVIIVNTDGDTLRTEQLFSNEEKEELYTESYVRINKSNGSVVEGTGFVSNFNFTDYVFKNPTGEIFLGD